MARKEVKSFDGAMLACGRGPTEEHGIWKGAVVTSKVRVRPMGTTRGTAVSVLRAPMHRTVQRLSAGAVIWSVA